MKYVKMLGLLAVAAAALMAFAASASATTLTSSTGETPTIHAVSATTELHGVADITCHESTVTGTVSSHGSTATTVGSISALTFGNCTNNNHVTVLNNGSGANGLGTLEVHPGKKTGEGILTSNGTRITIQITNLGISCIFETQNTQIGTVTGSAEGHAILDIESASIPRVSGDSGIFCGGPGEWTGSYEVTHPTGLTVH